MAHHNIRNTALWNPESRLRKVSGGSGLKPAAGLSAIDGALARR